MNVDRRADYIAVSRPATLDSINEIQATTDEGRIFLTRAHNTEDRNALTHWLCRADVAFGHIRSIGNEWAATVNDAPSIPHGQLIVWTAAEAA